MSSLSPSLPDVMIEPVVRAALLEDRPPLQHPAASAPAAGTFPGVLPEGGGAILGLQGGTDPILQPQQIILDVLDLWSIAHGRLSGRLSDSQPSY